MLAYLAAIKQPYRDDVTNQDCRFTRNRIRHELLPLLEQCYNPTIIESLLRLGELASQADREIHEQITPKLAAILRNRTENEVTLDRIELLQLSDFMIRELFATVWRQQRWPQQAMGFAQWQRLAASVKLQQTICLPGDIRVEATATGVHLERLRSADKH